ncbi:MAG TPA: HEAT repeat domain-containing protein [Vicinamibacterales bacterium]|nr:HEAT repeat domain-containing protein [Vicinamibacterales bacterium]
MVIRSSTAREVQQLVTELQQGSPVARESAIARLRVLGSRAVVRLSTLVRHDTSGAARAAGLTALAGIDDPRVVDIATRALGDPEAAVRHAAVLALRGWLVQETGTRVMDTLTSVALDAGQDAGVRSAARDALAQLPSEIVKPILEHTAAAASPPTMGDPAAIEDWLAGHAAAPLSSLHDLVVGIRQKESQEPDLSRRGWLAARGAIHAALARRDSRIALYDLRETFEAAAAPLPLDFLTAVTTIGDATCLEPMARAWARSPEDALWRERLAQSAADIVNRLALTARNPVVKRIRRKWKGFL